MFAAMASVALVSCVKNEGPSATANQEAEISFDVPVMSSVTKAVPGGVTEYVNPFDKASKFGVWAHYSDNLWADAALVSEVYMNEVEISYVGNNATSKAWKNSGMKYYWPKNGVLHFSAYAPYDGAEVTEAAEIGAAGVKFEDYTVKADLTNQRDLLFSERVYNAEAAGTGADNSYTDGVVINFQHALAAINFKVKLKESYYNSTTLKNDIDIIVTKIEVSGIKSTGNFDQALTPAVNSVTIKSKPANVGDTDYSSCWTAAADTVTYVAYEADTKAGDKYTSTEAIILTTDAVYTHTKTTNAAGKSTLMLLPQELSAGADPLMGAKVKVYYYVDNGTAYLDQVHTFSLDGEEWYRGYRHNYTISIGVNEIFFDPEVTDWDNVDEPTLEDHE